MPHQLTVALAGFIILNRGTELPESEGSFFGGKVSLSSWAQTVRVIKRNGHAIVSLRGVGCKMRYDFLVAKTN